MDFKAIGNGEQKYVECLSAKTPLGTEQDAMDLVAVCVEKDTSLLMLHGEVLSDDFFRLRAGVAGKMLQKFVNYRVKVAVVLPEEGLKKGRFREMVSEATKAINSGCSTAGRMRRAGS